jgi:hypothetical protein
MQTAAYLELKISYVPIATAYYLELEIKCM